MREILLLKLGEIILKGLNRGAFEARLMKNINRRLRPFGDFTVKCMQSTIFITPGKNADIDGAERAMAKVFGVVSICRAAECEKTLTAIIETAAEYLKPRLAAACTFKVTARRADKNFPLKSPELAAKIAEVLHKEHPHLKADMTAPELLIRAEVRDNFAYVHANPSPGAGGLPVGINGRAALLLSGGIDSPVAGHMIAKRGVELLGIHFATPPYTSERSKQKVLDLAAALAPYTGDIPVIIVNFTEIAESIKSCCKPDLYILLMRRFMMKIAEEIALAENCKALITGESLGQVASQTMEALAVTAAACSLPVLRPLIGLDKEEIVQIARKIETFELSVLPFDDCCAIFTPKHPKTRPTQSDISNEEKKLPMDGLVARAVAGAEKLLPPRNTERGQRYES